MGFFLQTYAHVLVDDDREAAQQAASFLIGDGWAQQPPEQDDELPNVPDRVPHGQ